MEDSLNLPDISLWDFLDGYSYLITEISASIHNAIGAFPQDNSLPIRIMVILILNKVKQDKKKKRQNTTYWKEAQNLSNNFSKLQSIIWVPSKIWFLGYILFI